MTAESARAESINAFTLDDRYLRDDGIVYLTGIQALVRVLLDRIRHDRRSSSRTAAFVSGYEGSPLAGFDLELARRAPLLTQHNVVHQPGLNEELAATSVMGSQLAPVLGRPRADGVVGLWYGKAPGLDRATDALRHANLAGTHPRGGALALVGDDPAAKSSTVPGTSDRSLADLAMPIFQPGDSQEILDYGLHAIELSRASGVWAAMKVVTDVADASGTAVVRPGWTAPRLATPASTAPYAHRPSARLLAGELEALERSLYTQRLPLATRYVRASGVNEITSATPHDRVGLVASGKSYLDLLQALRIMSLDEAALARFGIRVLKLGVIYPVEPVIVREFATGLSEIVVVEEKRSFIEAALKEILYGAPGAPPVYGKTGPDGATLFAETGGLGPDAIAAALARRLTAHGDIEPVDAWRGRRRRERRALPLLPRKPYFCSGCPHNSSTKVPDGALVGAGIGCHTMAVLMSPGQVGDVIGLTQMGGEGAQWIGAAPFTGHRHFVQNIGDGTFTHSGSLAIRAAVAAGVNITFKLLHNSAVAMTGGQRAVGALPVDRLAALLLLEGVTRVIITTDDPGRLRGAHLPRGAQVRHRDELLRSQRELAATPGVTVLIHDQECAAEKRRKRRRGAAAAPAAKVMINERVCEGCGDCGAKSNCLSVQPVATEFGRKTAIHQSSCNVDYSCLAGDCPSFVTVTPGARERRDIPELPADALPEPSPGGTGGDCTVRITGIGGAGVVTLAQVIATAAVMTGRHVRALDQTGLAQKGGAVVSDLKITAAPVRQAARLAAAECDLYLACDLLVAADPGHLETAAPDRTTSVVSTARVPTGEMISDAAIAFPDQDALGRAIADASARTWYVDARHLAESLFGHDQFANVLQLGAAYQYGVVPAGAAAIERAIWLNGVEVTRNVQAFRRGRQLVADPAALQAILQATETRPGTPKAAPSVSAAVARVRALVKAEEGTELARSLDVRVRDLIDYQDERYARTYAEFVETIRTLERDGTAITEAVARNLYKLMAYKDEYEVARLSLAPELTAGVKEGFGAGARYAYHLHPPFLRALGWKRKIKLGRWIRPTLRVLRAMRRIRGTRLDLFGRTRVRHVERTLIVDYREAMLRVLSTAPAADRAVVLELAELPEMIRGYEHIKLAGVAAYSRRQAELLAISTPPTAAAEGPATRVASG